MVLAYRYTLVLRAKRRSSIFPVAVTERFGFALLSFFTSALVGAPLSILCV